MQSLRQVCRITSLSTRIAKAHTRGLSNTPPLLRPTALHRAEEAADIKRHPESALTQEKLKDEKGSHHWVEENATQSEADIKADRAEGDESKKVESKEHLKPGEEDVPTFGERGFG